MDLTAKKRAFVDAVLAGKSNKDAAVLAGYSAKTASAAGSRLARDPAVVHFIGACIKETAATEGDKDDGDKLPPPSSFELSPEAPIVWTDAMVFLRAVMNHKATDMRHRINAAKAMLPFQYQQPGDRGKVWEDARQPALPGMEQPKGETWGGLLQ